MKNKFIRKIRGKNIDYNIVLPLIILLVFILCASSYYLISNLVKDKKENDEFKNLEQIIVENKTNEDSQNKEEKSNTTNYSNVDLNSLKNQNRDLIGWIRIDNTNINYPVMQNGNYYLRRNFYKKYSKLGTPYLADYCNIRTSDILTIFGHHINQGYMFADLIKYQNYDFYKSHKYIKFYTIENYETIENIYEVCFAFKIKAEKYNYYSYTKFYDEDDLKEFVENCQKLSIYNTDTKFDYGNQFITLSTCEYSQNNGRMIVIAKRITK